MRQTRFSLWLAVGLVFGACIPDAAAQGGGGGGFWEKMSGPGKWAYGYGYYSVCIRCGGSSVRTLTGRRTWLNLGGSFASTGDENRPGELVSPDLRALSFEPSMDFRVLPLRREDTAQALLVGVGAGVHRFWGEDVGFWRGSAEFRLTGVLYRRHNAYLGIRATAKVFPTGFTAADFGDPTGSYTTDGADWVYSFAGFFHIN